MRMHELAGRPVEDLVFAEMDGEIDTTDLRLLQDHLHSCQTCSAQRSLFRELHSRLSSASDDERAIERARRRSLQSIRTAVTHHTRPWLGQLASLRLFPVLVALALVAFGSLLVWVGQPTPQLARQAKIEVTRSVPGGAARFQVDQGPEHAASGNVWGVVVEVEVDLGEVIKERTAELWFRSDGDPATVIARTEIMASKTTVRAQLPDALQGDRRIAQVWLHLEPSGFDTAPLELELTRVEGGGTRATRVR